MVGVLTQYGFRNGMDAEDATQLFREAAQKFQHIGGLIRKYFFIREDGSGACGVYLWEDRESSEKYFTDDWLEFMTEKYGSRPAVTYFQCPVVVDNISHEIIET